MPLTVLVLLALMQTMSLTGPTTTVDAQTLQVGDTRVRLWGIRTPASGRECRFDDYVYDCGDQTLYSLSQLVDGRDARCEPKGEVDGVVVARCEVRWSECFGVSCTEYWRDPVEVLVADGEAVQDPAESGGAYDKAEGEARLQQAGVWHDPQGGGLVEVNPATLN